VYWVEEQTPGGAAALRLVPAPGAAPVPYSSLVALDPLTVDPAAAPAPLWFAYVDQLEATTAAALVAAQQAAVDAHTAHVETSQAMAVAMAVAL
jgi:hypothetical protein